MRLVRHRRNMRWARYGVHAVLLLWVILCNWNP